MEGGKTSDYISNYKKHSIAVNIIAKKKKKDLQARNRKNLLNL